MDGSAWQQWQGGGEVRNPSWGNGRFGGHAWDAPRSPSASDDHPEHNHGDHAVRHVEPEQLSNEDRAIRRLGLLGPLRNTSSTDVALLDSIRCSHRKHTNPKNSKRVDQWLIAPLPHRCGTPEEMGISLCTNRWEVCRETRVIAAATYYGTRYWVSSFLRSLSAAIS